MDFTDKVCLKLQCAFINGDYARIKRYLQRRARGLGIHTGRIAGRKAGVNFREAMPGEERLGYNLTHVEFGFGAKGQGGRHRPEIGIDQGIWNHELRQTHEIRATARFRDVVDAVLTHEYYEVFARLSLGLSISKAHCWALNNAPQNPLELNVSDEVRALLRNLPGIRGGNNYESDS